MRIAVDFDGTLAGWGRYPVPGEPNEEVFEAVKRLQKSGHQIILWTCREGHHLDMAIRYCEDRDLRFDAVNETLYSYVPGLGKRKVIADIYIDDKAIRPDEIHMIDQFMERVEINDGRMRKDLKGIKLSP